MKYRCASRHRGSPVEQYWGEEIVAKGELDIAIVDRDQIIHGMVHMQKTLDPTLNVLGHLKQMVIQGRKLGVVGATPSKAQSLLLPLCSRITPRGAEGSICSAWVQTGFIYL